MGDSYVLFVDADNIPGTMMSQVLDIIKERGRIVTCKVVGDFTRPELFPWKNICLNYNLDAIIAWHKPGGNSSDLKICQDCVHFMYTHPSIQNYVLITGDGDFTTIIKDLKMHGKNVICMGLRQQSSAVLQRCCDEFIALVPKQTGTQKKKNPLVSALQTAITCLLDKEPNIDLSQIKTKLLLANPNFTERNFGTTSMKKLMELMGYTVYLTQKNGVSFGPYVKKI